MALGGQAACQVAKALGHILPSPMGTIGLPILSIKGAEVAL